MTLSGIRSSNRSPEAIAPGRPLPSGAAPRSRPSSQSGKARGVERAGVGTRASLRGPDAGAERAPLGRDGGCGSPRCWCSWPPVRVIQSTGTRWTIEELARDGNARYYGYKYEAGA